MARNIYSNQIIGKINGDLINVNVIKCVEYDTNTLSFKNANIFTLNFNGFNSNTDVNKIEDISSNNAFSTTETAITGQEGTTLGWTYKFKRFNQTVYTKNAFIDSTFENLKCSYDRRYLVSEKTSAKANYELKRTIERHFDMIKDFGVYKNVSDFESNLRDVAEVSLGIIENLSDNNKIHIEFRVRHFGEIHTGQDFHQREHVVSLNVNIYLNIYEEKNIVKSVGDLTKKRFKLESNELFQSTTILTNQNIITIDRGLTGLINIKSTSPVTTEIRATIKNIALGITSEFVLVIPIGSTKSDTKQVNIYSITLIKSISPPFDSDFIYDINYITIGSYISNSIIDEYKDGKQTLSVTIAIAEDDDMITVGDHVIVYDFNNNPISRNRNGQAKEFLVTSAELKYNGAYRQNLEMVEVV